MTPEQEEITVGIPVKDEKNSIKGLLEDLFRQKIPAEKRLTIIIVTNNSTDGSPLEVEKNITGWSEKLGGKIIKSELPWPTAELESLYKKQGWLCDENGITKKTQLKITSWQSTDGSKKIIHIDTSVGSKNNALNIIRHLSGTDLIISIDADIKLQPFTIIQLHKAKNKLYAATAGTLIPYYDHNTVWSKIRNYFLKKNTFPPAQQPEIWGGLFSYDRTKIPVFPYDLMYEDRWLTEFCGNTKNHCPFNKAKFSLGFQRRPGTFRDEQNESQRFMIHEAQLKALHSHELSQNFIPRIRMSRRDVIKNFRKLSATPRPKFLGPLFTFIMSRLEIHNAKTARNRIKKLLSENNNDWSNIRSFARIKSSKS